MNGFWLCRRERSVGLAVMAHVSITRRHTSSMTSSSCGPTADTGSAALPSLLLDQTTRAGPPTGAAAVGFGAGLVPARTAGVGRVDVVDGSHSASVGVVSTRTGSRGPGSG